MEICEIVKKNNQQGLSLRVIDQTLKEELPYIECHIPIFEAHFRLRELAFENNFVIVLDIRDIPYATCRLGIGDIDYVDSCRKQALIFGLISGCKSFYTLHNHPSNLAATPSNEDIELEKETKNISDIIGLKYNGEIIIARDQWSITHLGKTKYLNWDTKELKELENYECEIRE